MKKVMIVGSAFRNYNSVSEKAFKQIGFLTKVFSSPLMGIKRHHILTRIKRKLGLNVSSYYDKMREGISKSAFNVYKEFDPMVVYVSLGNMLTEKETQMMSKKSIMILNLTDPLSFVPETKKCLKYYDLIYTYEKTDINAIYEITGKYPKTLFGLFSSDVYYPIGIEKDIDIYFVGAMYPFRTEIMINLIRDFPSLRIEIDGDYDMFKESKKLIEQSPIQIRKCFSNKNISAEEINKKYNRSKICLNLQHPQTQDGWNSRLTEILGAQAFEIATANPSVNQTFTDCLVTYRTYVELRDAVDYYITHDEERENIAENGYDKAVASYTYASGFQSVVNDIETEGLWKKVETNNS